MHPPSFVADLAVVLGVGALTGVLFRLLRQPSILGYLLAGLIVGPYIPIPVFADPVRVEAMAEFGVVLVMFAVGLEFRIAKLLRVLPVSGVTGLVQVSFLLWCGFGLGRILGWSTLDSVFLGACISISSTMIVSKVFEQRPVPPDVRSHVLGILVIQDVLAILLIAAMTAVAAGGGLEAGALALTLTRLAGVLLGMLAVGLVVVPRIVRFVARLGSPEILGVVAVGLCFVVARVAAELGYSMALGAFLAGILVAESGRGKRVEGLIGPVRDMFAAIFFVSIGMTVDPVQAWRHLPVSLLVSAVIVVAQFGSVTVAGLLSGSGLRRAVPAALSLGQIGEFAFILAAIGTGEVREELQPIVVTVAVVTAFTTPLLLGLSGTVVDRIDRLLPHRVQHFLALYEEWLGRSRADRAASPGPGPLRALSFDAAALIVLGAVSVALGPSLAEWTAERIGGREALARALLAALAVVLALPLLVALVRNTLALSRRVVERAMPAEDGHAPAGSPLAAHSLRAMICLSVLLAVGAPAVATIRLLTGEFYGVALFGPLLLAVGFHLWRSAGRVEREYRSAAGELARTLARQAGPFEEETASTSALIPGLDSVERVRVHAGDHAIGRTLAELNLRAVTGATVVAIHHPDADAPLPTGREHLRPDSVLALVGTSESIEQARKLLIDGPSR